jgi:hypothetical protein
MGQERCPCCGTSMVVVEETGSKLTLRCPACLTSDVRLKP